MDNKSILTGNQAIARGFYEANGKVASSYPGSPTVEILESINEYDNIYSEFSINEKVALEVGVGSSIAGYKSLVSMKHVGVNICMDPLMTFVQTKTNGGFLLVTGDDPGLSSSQNEQDNRILGKFANMGIVDPSNSQDAKDFVKEALYISEKFNIPMMLRITSKLCHSRGIVKLEDKESNSSCEFTPDISRYCMLPPYADAAQFHMKERLQKLEDYAYDCNLNKLEEVNTSNTLIITSGLMYENLKELDLDISIYKLGLVYPISIKKIKELSSKYENIIVIEEMMPFIENELKINGIHCKGKDYFSFTGELQTEDIKKCLIELGIINKSRNITSSNINKLDIPSRSPMFCSGCPHRPVFDILKKSKSFVIGDIGCYSMSILFPFEVSKINISMGSSLGIIKGMCKANKLDNNNKPLVAVIGDGTFFHSGINGAINLFHQLEDDDNITIILLDNGATAMTGGQANASSGLKDFGDMNISIDNLLKTIGFNDITVVDQFDYDHTKKVINNAIKRNGISFVITSRPCSLKFKIKEPHFYVDPDICIGCRSCVKTNCPPIIMKKYKNHDKLKSFIDPTMCVGCSVCAQVCPVNAIKSSK